MGMGGSVGMSMGAPRGTALTLVASSGMEGCAVSSVLHDRLSVDRFESESSCSESECSPNPPASMDKSSKDISHASREAACMPLPLPLPLPSRPRLIAAAAPPSMAVLEWRRLMPVPCICPVGRRRAWPCCAATSAPTRLLNMPFQRFLTAFSALLARAAWDQLGDAHPLRRPALDGLGVARDELAQVVLLGGPRVVQRLGGVLEVAAAAHDGVAQLHVLVGRPVDAVGGGIHRWAVARETDGGLPANVRRRLRAVSS